MRVYLSGMPELRLGLNDKVQFENSGRMLIIWHLNIIFKEEKTKQSNWKTSSFISAFVCHVLKTTERLALFHQMANSS